MVNGKAVVGLKTIDDFDSSMTSLTDSMVSEIPFLCTDWLRQFERQLLKANERPLYVVVSDNNRAELILPLIIETSTWFRVKKIRSMANFYTGIYAPIVSANVSNDKTAMRACVEAAIKYLNAHWGSCALFELEPLRGNSDLYDLILEVAGNVGYRVRRYEVTVNWYERFDEPPNYVDYLKARPGQLRSTLKRRMKLLQTNANHDFVVSSTGPEISKALIDFNTVYEQSWKPQESYPDFIADIFQLLAERNYVRVGILYVNSQPSAAQIWIRIGDGWGVFKLAYRPDDAKYSVGTLLTAHMIQVFLAMPETRCVDFLSGDDRYKRDWVTQKRNHWGIEAVNERSFWGRVALLKRTISGGATSNVDLHENTHVVP